MQDWHPRVFLDKPWPQWHSHGPQVERFLRAYMALPDATPTQISFGDYVTVGEACDIDCPDFESRLHMFQPWRKGPFSLFGVTIDTEWKSYLKWCRIMPHLPSLTGKKIVDIGCGSGYYMWRMWDQKPDAILGIDPAMTYWFQFHVIQKYANIPQIQFWPIRFDPHMLDPQSMDVVFCMGVLYHQRDPLDYLRQIRPVLGKHGILILETLIVEGSELSGLYPKSTYAKMPHITCIPALPMLMQWIEQAGYAEATVVSLSHTTTDEQRKTSWMLGQSLEHFLDPYNPSLTIEGYPAPVRAVLKIVLI